MRRQTETSVLLGTALAPAARMWQGGATVLKVGANRKKLAPTF